MLVPLARPMWHRLAMGIKKNPRFALLEQFFRFALVGGFVTFLSVAIYWVAATSFKVAPQLANAIAYGISMVVGYFLHSLLTFREPGKRRDPMTSVRFLVSNLVGWSLNSLWVWLLTAVLRGPTWWPIIPMVLVTPPATFLINRNWVFRQS
jgi:putative flippase GtrA